VRNITGDALTTLFGTPQLMPKPKHSMLPVLVVLFLFSYGLMTLLIVEQGSTIQSQRMLIRELLGDTHELASMKGKALRDQALSRQAQTKNGSSASANETPSTQVPLTQAPSNQNPSTQSPTANAPSAQAGSAKTRNRNSKALPPAPAKPASDLVDVRRNLLSI
jgi:hypothetical protein